jgi:hypothetical protein
VESVYFGMNPCRRTLRCVLNFRIADDTIRTVQPFCLTKADVLNYTNNPDFL